MHYNVRVAKTNRTQHAPLGRAEHHIGALMQKLIQLHHFIYVNTSPIQYGFCAATQAIQYDVSIVKIHWKLVNIEVKKSIYVRKYVIAIG
jgi:hypothetical protein